MDDEPTSSFSRPLIQELHISGFDEDNVKTLNQLSELGLVFDELLVETPSRAYTGAIETVGVNAKRIRLCGTNHPCMYSHKSPQ